MSINPLLNSSYTNSLNRSANQPYTGTSQLTGSPYAPSNNQLSPLSSLNSSLDNLMSPSSKTVAGLQSLIPELSGLLKNFNHTFNPSTQNQFSNSLQNKAYNPFNSSQNPSLQNPQNSSLQNSSLNQQVNPNNPQQQQQGSTNNTTQTAASSLGQNTTSNLQQGVANNNPSVAASSSSSNGGMVDGTSIEPLDGQTTADDNPDDAETAPSYEDNGGVDPWADGSDGYGTDLGQPGGSKPSPTESTTGTEEPASLSGQTPATAYSTPTTPTSTLSQPSLATQQSRAGQPMASSQVSNILSNYSGVLKNMMGGNANGLTFNQGTIPNALTNIPIRCSVASNPFLSAGKATSNV